MGDWVCPLGDANSALDEWRLCDWVRLLGVANSALDEWIYQTNEVAASSAAHPDPKRRAGEIAYPQTIGKS
ncbi:hypothetical protein [Acanthopleuribacter pedis]|uniref:Uncharacterized protein n=1 Tax=Acanthopleuribacter pedis TaxID=442870 RepID=A0A8J7U3C7_9BACT|nr:hypothetical protein [Acanthopleuribacter pedis]MBO1318208.1 hypothetical protein [Acanthopleuribacter pedis]